MGLSLRNWSGGGKVGASTSKQVAGSDGSAPAVSDEENAADFGSRRFDAGLLFVGGLFAASGAAVWWIHGVDRFLHLLFADLLLVAEMFPKVAEGAVLAAALAVAVPRERVVALVGPESGVRGLAIAMAAGLAFPGGPSVIYPFAVAMLAAGADVGVAVAMITSWVLLSLNRTVVWEFTFLPSWLVLLRYGLSLPIPILLGLAVCHLAAPQRRRRST